jgi:hypothetical protein
MNFERMLFDQTTYLGHRRVDGQRMWGVSSPTLPFKMSFRKYYQPFLFSKYLYKIYFFRKLVILIKKPIFCKYETVPTFPQIFSKDP